MRIDSTVYVPAVTRQAAYLDWLQMFTGLCLISFMYLHALFVASIIFGTGAFNALANFFEDYYLAQVGGPLIVLIFFAHFILAARKIPFRSEQQKKLWFQSKMLAHRDTWMWVVQVVSAMIILIMGAIHMWVVLTDLPITADKSAARIQSGFWLTFYLILLPMVELHVGVGWYRLGVKWGFIKSQARKKVKKFEYYITGFFIFLGLITLIRFLFVKI
ncbi:fumarate reductase [Desulfonatronovibrio hydrogenovorans]|uniref:fumarate reductase n=1 Tax=Desulfonatronovibrio hydrogenovorans TaxID=53245 RepID=UPI00049189C0|nr:fumarate reductase [Desulfonatronovibrio hydrogenovorans]